VNIYKLLAASLLTLAFMVGAPILAASRSLIGPFNEKAWFILLITACFLVFKAFIGDFVAGQFLFHKYGYDNCLVTMGGVLTALATQIVSNDDLYPGMGAVIGIRSIPPLTSSAVQNRAAQLAFCLALSLAATLVTARISSEITSGRAAAKDLLALLNTAIGVSVLAIYVLVLISKG
jgi:hypothetical protein